MNNSELEDAEAQYKHALQYIDGEVVPRDFNEAAIWLRKASAQGVADAQYLLGIMHEGGEGATQDIQQAISYMRKAAEQGHTEAQARLVVLEEKSNAGNYSSELNAQAQASIATSHTNEGASYSIGRLVGRKWRELMVSKKRDYFDLLDILPGAALGQSLSKGVLTIFHGSPDASGNAAGISFMLGGAVGYVLCRYARTQFTKNMQSRSAVIFWSFAISFGLVLAIITTAVLLKKSAAQPTSDGIIDPFAPGYVAAQPRESQDCEKMARSFADDAAKDVCTDSQWASYPGQCQSMAKQEWQKTYIYVRKNFGEGGNLRYLGCGK